MSPRDCLEGHDGAWPSKMPADPAADRPDGKANLFFSHQMFDTDKVYGFGRASGGRGMGREGRTCMLELILPDGKSLRFERRVRGLDVVGALGPRWAKTALAAKLDDRLVDLLTYLPEEGRFDFRLLTQRDAEVLPLMRHSAAHLMARAVMRLFPGAKLAFGPPVENGFYYDFLLPRSLTEDDFSGIEAEMARLAELDEPFERIEVPRDKAVEICRELDQPFKVEHLEDGLRNETTVSFYRQGEFLDLCEGPHVPSAGWIKAFKLLSVAGAYWRGDAARQQLQRLYATAWFSQDEMRQYLDRLAEAKKRDHRVLGKRLELFTIEPTVGSGLILWLPKGAILRRELENFLYEELMRRGYQAVYTPHIGRVELYQTSGHYHYYADSQFRPIQMS